MIIDSANQPVTDEMYEEWMNRPYSDSEKRVESLFAELSQELLHSSWNLGLEFIVWRWLQTGLTEEDYYGRREEHDMEQIQAWLEELRSLTIDAGWWPHYPDDSSSLGYKVPSTEWEEIYATSVQELEAAHESFLKHR